MQFVRKIVDQAEQLAWSWLEFHAARRDRKPEAVPVQVLVREADYEEKVDRMVRPELELVLTHLTTIRRAGYRTSTALVRELVVSLNHQAARELHSAIEDCFLSAVLCPALAKMPDPAAHNVNTCAHCLAQHNLRQQRWGASVAAFEALKKRISRSAQSRRR